MYIPVSEKTYKALKQNVVATAKFGSTIYGCETDKSDVDMLYLYHDVNFSGIIKDTNGWQYKEDGVDHNFQEIRVYLYNLINGVNHTDYEALQCGFSVYDDKLNDLLSYVDIVTYRLVKCYIGRLKKDLKAFYKDGFFDRRKTDALLKKQYYTYLGSSYIENFLFGSELASSETLKDIRENGMSVDELHNILRNMKDYNTELEALVESGILSRRPSANWFKKLDNLYKFTVNKLDKIAHFSFIDFEGMEYEILEHTSSGIHENKNKK